MSYEYKVLSMNNDSPTNLENQIEKNLNQMGDLGWEVVTILNQQGVGKSRYNLLGVTTQFYLVLKR